MDNTKKCPKCSSEMEEGNLPTMWVDSLKKLLPQGKAIISYRCKECGFLENYAK